MFIFEDYLIIIIPIIIIILFTKRIIYSNNNQIPKISISYKSLFTLRLSSICSEAYTKCRKNNYPLAQFRLFFKPVVFISDQQLLNQLESQYFPNRGSYYNIPSDAENLHLFNMKNVQWTEWRKTMGKCFKPEKLKQAVLVFDSHVKTVLSEVNSEVVDIFHLCSKFSFLVASQMFLSHTPTSFDLFKFDKLYNPGRWNKFVDVFGYVCPSVLRFFHICDIPRTVFFYLKEILNREIDRQDNCNPESILYELMMKNDDDGISKEEIIGMMIGLFVGSLKSTSSFLAYCCYELAKATDVQDKLRSEIVDTLEASVTEDCDYLSSKHLQEMRLMRISLDEILRLYTGGPLLIRECNETFTFSLPHHSNGRNGNNHNFQVEKGTLIFASLRRILTDPEYYPDPDVFNPERFDNTSNSQKPEHKFLPFGVGKRICIGNKFVMFQAKVFLTRILSSYKLSLNENTAANLLDGTNRLKEGFIYLNLEPLNKES